jgi:hypothetical protein
MRCIREIVLVRSELKCVISITKFSYLLQLYTALVRSLDGDIERVSVAVGTSAQGCGVGVVESKSESEGILGGVGVGKNVPTPT